MEGTPARPAEDSTSTSTTVVFSTVTRSTSVTRHGVEKADAFIRRSGSTLYVRVSKKKRSRAQSRVRI